MKAFQKLIVIVFCCVFCLVGFAACGGSSMDVSVSEDGYLIVNGEQTDVLIGKDGTDGADGANGENGINGENGKSAYELFLEQNPDYTGSEEQWMNDMASGMLAPSHEYAIVSYGRNYDADIISGTVSSATDGVKLSNAVLALNKPAIMPIGEGANWQVDIRGTLLPGGSGGGQFLTSGYLTPSGRIYFGINAGNNVLFIGVNIDGKYFNYCWNVPSSTMSGEHEYSFSYKNGEYLLSVDGAADQHLASLNVNQANITQISDSAAASRELNDKIRAVTGQDFFTFTNIGADSHKCTLNLYSLKITTSSIYGYETLAKHPLAEKTIYYLGSSITRGHGGNTDGRSYVEQIAELTGNTYQKEAISGTTLANFSDTSYVARYDNFDFDNEPDALVVQLSTNDFSQGVPVGAVTDSIDPADMNQQSLTGAIEYIIAKTRELSPNTKVIFYTCPLGQSWGQRAEYSSYISGTLRQLVEKWDIGVIDVFNAEYIDVACYMQSDNLHPQSEGYAGVITPMFINYFLENL